MTLDTRDRNTIALAALRIFVGMLFLIFGDYKVFGAEFIWGGGFQLWINRFLVEGAYPFMIPVLQKFARASLNHSVLALCFAVLIFGEADRALSIRSSWPLIVGQQKTSATRSSPKSGTRSREMKSCSES
jgi:hypothetical protein